MDFKILDRRQFLKIIGVYAGSKVFLASLGLNIYSISRYNTDWSELIGLLPVVIGITLILYLLVLLFRLVFLGITKLIQKTNMKGTFGLIFILFLGFQGFSQVKMEKAEEGFLFTEEGKNVLFYQSSPKSIDGQFERCNYIHPLWGLKEKILTEDFPSDHLHQRGVFWAWHQIWIGDKRIGDGWELKNIEYWINEIEFAPNSMGAAVLKTEVHLKSENWTRLGQKIPFLKENNTITINPKKGNYRKIDFKIELLALEENLKIGGSEDEKGYGGFSVRMKLPDDVSFNGPDGVIEPKATQVESGGYVNIAGSIGSKNSQGGIVIVDNSGNPGFPQNWILREKESMQNVVYPGNKTIPLSTTEPLVLKYSLIIYSGKMNNRKIQKILN